MCMHRTYINPHDMAPLENRVSQITNVFQKIFWEMLHYFMLCLFRKIIGLEKYT